MKHRKIVQTLFFDIRGYSQTCLCGHLYKGITSLKQPPFLGPLNQNIVQMNLYLGVTCLN